MAKKKTCTACGKPKILSEFYDKKGGKFGKTSQCKLCHRKTCNRSYEKNKDAYKKRALKTNRQRRLNFYNFIKAEKSKPCTDCKHSFPWYVMDFDHVRGRKLFSVSQGCTLSRERVIKEIAKCDLVCSNCHRIRTYKRKEKPTYEKERQMSLPC